MMDKKKVLKMGPGRKMDFLVDQKVLGNRFHSSVNSAPSKMSIEHNREIPHYSTNAYSAEKVLEKTREKYPIILQAANLWECKVFLPTGAVVSSGLTQSLSLAICRAALLTAIEEERQDKIKELENKQKFGILLREDLNMEKKDKKWSKLLISTCSFFIIALILLSLWNTFLAKEIKRSGEEREAIKKDIEKIEILEKTNRNFRKDVLKQKSIEFCFWELIREFGEKYTNKEIQDCIQLIAMADERHGNKGLDAPLILAWLEIESSGNPEAISYAGAKGLTQLMDFKAEEVFTAMGYSGYEKKLVFNPVVNLGGGLYHLERLMNFWEWEGIRNQSLILFYALHSYKWGAANTGELFNSGRKAFRPAVKYVNWILNRREYWKKEFEYWMDNRQKLAKEKEK